jgi:hypothetical protein
MGSIFDAATNTTNLLDYVFFVRLSSLCGKIQCYKKSSNTDSIDVKKSYLF